MRRRLALTALAITTTVTLAFGAPLAVVVQRVAADRALNEAEVEARSLIVALASISDRATLNAIVTAFERSDRQVSVFLADGTVLGAPAAVDDAVRLAQQGRSFTADVPGGKAVLVPVVHADRSVDVARVFVSDSTLRRGVLASWLLLGGLAALLVAIGVLLADRLGRAVVRPIGELAGVARHLAAGQLDTRAREQGPPEVVDVSRAVNRLATRIGELLAAERESVADLSHRLRTPLAALRLEVEGLPEGEDRIRLMAVTDEMARSVDRLIDEARRPLREGIDVKCDVAAVARDRVGFWAALADDENRSWAVDVPDHAVPVRCHGDDLAAGLDALLGNVLAHTPVGTAFHVAVREDDGAVHLVVSDDGPGIDDHSLLERGVSGGGSTGLGLDIMRRTAEAAGGELVVRRSAAGGAEVDVNLGPVATP
jgi:signal transduction histidine kinase